MSVAQFEHGSPKDIQDDSLQQTAQDPAPMTTGKPARKRRKNQEHAVDQTPAEKPTRLRGKRGLLKALTDAPIDVLFEVSLYVYATYTPEHGHRYSAT